MNRRYLVWLFGLVLWMTIPQNMAGQSVSDVGWTADSVAVVNLANPVNSSRYASGSVVDRPMQEQLGDVNWSQPLLAPISNQGRPGVVGALVGAGIGAAASGLAVLVLCDAENCLTHPDSRKLVVGAVLTGAMLGYAVDWALHRR